MFEDKVSDLHLHLNGSYTPDFLSATAQRNNAANEFLELKRIREEYGKLANENSSEDILNKSIPLIWAQFALIHKIIKTLDDIRYGTLDVINASTAAYLEIRTTAKQMDGGSRDKYIDAFCDGLVEGNKKFAGKKIVRGILSLDRSFHSAEDAYEIIDRVITEKNRSGLLVGVDISGNPIAERTLTGRKLAEVVNYILDNDIGAGIHVGEVTTATEKTDTDILLDVFNSWHHKRKDSSNDCFKGKVRLGHAIFLTDDQQKLIRKLQIPIEVCPSCHQKLNWWKTNCAHPVTNIYQSWTDPVVSGTDDEMIFGANAEEENERVLEILAFPKSKNKEEIRRHQSTFRFSF